MKKKILVFAVLPLMCGCVQVLSDPSKSIVDVSWEQNGKDCVYKEEFGEIKREWDQTNSDIYVEVDKRYVSAVKTIKYGNTLCSKVIDAELKNTTNKSALTNNFHQLNSISRTNITTQMQQSY